MTQQRRGPAPIEFTFQDLKTNKTIILEGHFEPIPMRNINISTTPLPTHFLEGPTGPMLYVLAVILVYGLSMFLIVGTLARKKSYHKQLDNQVGQYVKGLDKARQEARRQEVQSLRLNWPGNYIQQFNNPPDGESDGDNGSHSEGSEYMEYNATTKSVNGDETSSSASGHTSDESSYTELPATTLIYVDEASSCNMSESDSIHSEAVSEQKDFLTVPLKTYTGRTEKKMSVQFTEFSHEEISGSVYQPRRDDISHKSASSIEMQSYKTDLSISKQSLSMEHVSTAGTLVLDKTDSKKHMQNSSEHILNERRAAFISGRGPSLEDHDEMTASDDISPNKTQKRKRKISILKPFQRARRNTMMGLENEKKPHHNFFHLPQTHRKASLNKSGGSADSVQDLDVYEEYRHSKEYQMRTNRGRKAKNLVLDDLIAFSRFSGNSSGESSPMLSDGSRNKLDAVSPALQKRLKKISTVSSPFLVSGEPSDPSDIDDPVLEKYKHSNAYRSRTRRHGILDETKPCFQKRPSRLSTISSPMAFIDPSDHSDIDDTGFEQYKQTSAYPYKAKRQSMFDEIPKHLPKRQARMSTVSSPMALLEPSDNSDVDDSILGEYKHSRAYQSRTKGRKGVIYE